MQQRSLSRRSARAIAVTSIWLMAACTPGGLGVGSVDECVQRYAVVAATEEGVRFGYRLCRNLFDEAPSGWSDEFIQCALPRLSEAKNHLALQLVVKDCRSKG